jgi:hypothetical protein
VEHVQPHLTLYAKLTTSCKVGWEIELSSVWNAEQR